MAGESEKIRRRHIGCLIVPGLLVVFCIWYASIILELPQGPGEEGPLGPSFVPWLWASLLVVLTLIDIGVDALGGSEKGPRVFMASKSLLDALGLTLLLVGFVLAIQYGGFFAATAAFLVIGIRWSGIRTWKLILLYAILFAAVINYVFYHLLKVPLPQDWLF